jgi:hypothetical protein
MSGFRVFPTWRLEDIVYRSVPIYEMIRVVSTEDVYKVDWRFGCWRVSDDISE